MSSITGTLNKTGSLSGALSGTGGLSGIIGKRKSEIPYAGPYEIEPSLESDITLYTAKKTCSQDIVVLQVPIDEVLNPYGGLTLTIGKE